MAQPGVRDRTFVKSFKVVPDLLERGIILSVFSRHEHVPEVCGSLQGLHLLDSSCLPDHLLGQTKVEEARFHVCLPPHSEPISSLPPDLTPPPCFSYS